MTSKSPTRDRLTWISYFQAACFGWIIYGFGPAVQLLRTDLHLSTTVTALHSLFLATGSILAGIIGAGLTHRVGRGVLLRMASFILLSSTIVFVSTHTVALTLLSALFFGLAGSTIVQSTAAFLDAHQGDSAPSAISELHAVTAGIGLFSPVLIGLSVSLDLGWRTAVLVVAIGIVTLELVRGRFIHPYSVQNIEQEQNLNEPSSSLPWLYWSCLVVMVCTASTEFSMLFWSSELLQQQGGLGAGASTAALGCVVGAMFIGRWLGARLATKFDAETLYLALLVLSLVGFLIFWLDDQAVIMMVGLTLTGLGMSVHFPLGIARAMRASAGQTDRAAGIISIGAGLASGIAPFALGTLADRASTHTAYAIVPIVLTVGIFFANFNRVDATQKQGI